MGNFLSSLPKTIHTSIAISILLFLGLFFNNEGFDINLDMPEIDEVELKNEL